MAANSGRIDLIYRGLDTAFYQKAWNGTNINTGWAHLGGNFIYDPVTLHWGPDLVYIFGIGFDSVIYYKSVHKITGVWSTNWIQLKAVRAPVDGTRSSEPLRWAAKPAVISLYPKSMELVGLGSDNRYYHSSWRAGEWSDFSPLLEKHFREPPSLTAWGSGRFDVFGLGLDGNVYHRWWSKKTGWLPDLRSPTNPTAPTSSIFAEVDLEATDTPLSATENSAATIGGGGEEGVETATQRDAVPAWENLQGPFVNTPSAISWAKGRIDLVGVGVKGKIYHRFWDRDADAWSGTWNEVKMTSNPMGNIEVVSWGPNRLDVFFIGGGRGIHHKWLNASGGNNTWEPSDEENLGGEVAGDQISAACMGKDNLAIFHIGRDSTVYVKSWTAAAGWNPAQYTSLGASVPRRLVASATQDALFNP